MALGLHRHCERSEAIQLSLKQEGKELECFVASLLAMTEELNQLPHRR
jgi:hypothetical protein